MYSKVILLQLLQKMHLFSFWFYAVDKKLDQNHHDFNLCIIILVQLPNNTSTMLSQSFMYIFFFLFEHNQAAVLETP
jgi:hypothetical protein